MLKEIQERIRSYELRLETQKETIEEAQARLTRIDASKPENLGRIELYAKMIRDYSENMLETTRKLATFRANLSA